LEVSLEKVSTLLPTEGSGVKEKTEREQSSMRSLK